MTLPAKMAQAIEESVRDGAPVLEAVHRAAAERGTALGDETREKVGPRPKGERKH